MAGKIKQRLKKGIHQIKGLFDRSPSGSQPSTSSTQLAFTPPTSVTNLHPTPYHFNQSSAPSAAILSNLQPGDGNENPLAAPIPPAHQRLRTEPNVLFHDLPGYFSESTPPDIKPSIADLAEGIERELGLIEKKRREQLESTRQLAASLFCARQLPKCRDVNRIVATIPYQLARFSRPFRYAISRVLADNPDVYNQLLLDQGHTSRVLSVAYSADSAYIVSGSDDKTIRIWDAHTGQSVGQPLQGHTSSVDSVAYSPGGAYVVSGSHDNATRIWDVQLGCRINGYNTVWTSNSDGSVATHKSKLLIRSKA